MAPYGKVKFTQFIMTERIGAKLQHYNIRTIFAHNSTHDSLKEVHVAGVGDALLQWNI